MSKPEIFADTVVLSNFVFGGLFENLLQRYGEHLRITTQVLDEIESGIAVGYTELEIIHEAVKNNRLKTIPLDKAEYDFYSSLLANLGRGEASCISCARNRKAVIATDDRAARRVCIKHNIKITGTIGILKSAVTTGMLSIDAAEAALVRMSSAGFYSPIKRLEDII